MNLNLPTFSFFTINDVFKGKELKIKITFFKGFFAFRSIKLKIDGSWSNQNKLYHLNIQLLYDQECLTGKKQ